MTAEQVAGRSIPSNTQERRAPLTALSLEEMLLQRLNIVSLAGIPPTDFIVPKMAVIIDAALQVDNSVLTLLVREEVEDIEGEISVDEGEHERVQGEKPVEQAQQEEHLSLKDKKSLLAYFLWFPARSTSMISQYLGETGRSGINSLLDPVMDNPKLLAKYEQVEVFSQIVQEMNKGRVDIYLLKAKTLQIVKWLNEGLTVKQILAKKDELSEMARRKEMRLQMRRWRAGIHEDGTPLA